MFDEKAYVIKNNCNSNCNLYKEVLINEKYVLKLYFLLFNLS